MPAPYRVGEIVWAKIKGFPSWPATIQDPKEATDYSGSNKVPKGKKVHYFVKFFVADENGQDSVAWTPVDDIQDFAPELTKMKDHANSKGGKTYRDLKTCIDKAEDAHRVYLEEIAKNPEKAAAAAVSAGTSNTPPASIGADKPTTSKSPKAPAPAAKSTGNKKQSNTASESEPEGRNEVDNRTPQKLVIKVPKQPQPSTPSSAAGIPVAKASTSSSNASGKKRTAESESAVGSETDGTSSTPSRASNGQPPNKRKVIPTQKVAQNAAQNNQQKKSQVSPARATSNQPKPASTAVEKKTVNAKTQGASDALDKAKKISLGLMGSFEDHRTVHVARQLLHKGIRVRFWDQHGPSSSSKDLEGSKAERVSDGEKLFEESDIVFLSATSQQQITTLLSGQEHLLLKIRPAQGGKVKGVCVFSSFGKDESKNLKLRLSPKNIEYLECAWIGNVSSGKEEESTLRLIAGGSRRLFDQTLKPLCDVLGGGPEVCTFLSEEVGVVSVVKSAVTMAQNVALAGIVEAAVFAQKHGADLSLLQASLAASGLADTSLMAKVKDIVQFQSGKQQQEKSTSAFKDSYIAMRDAVRLASYPTNGPASITPLASSVMDMFHTEFITYRHERMDDSEEQSGAESSTSTKQESLEKEKPKLSRDDPEKGADDEDRMKNGGESSNETEGDVKTKKSGNQKDEKKKDEKKNGAGEVNGEKEVNGDEAAGDEEEEKALKMDV